MQKAQTTLETVIFIIVFVAAYLLMQGYFSRSLQGNLQAQADTFSDEQFDEAESTEHSDFTGVITEDSPLVSRQPAIVVSQTNLGIEVDQNGNGATNDPEDLKRNVVLESSGRRPIQIREWGTYE